MSDKKIQVIIADDNKEFSDILSEYLNSQGDIEVVGMAKDGNEACELIAERMPDIVILDIIMPHLDGLGVLENVRSMQLKKRPLFIILSAVGQDKITQRALALGAEYYIVNHSIWMSGFPYKAAQEFESQPDHRSDYVSDIRSSYRSTTSATSRWKSQM